MRNQIANTIFNTFITLLGTGTFGAICFAFYTVLTFQYKIIYDNQCPKGLLVAKNKNQKL